MEAVFSNVQCKSVNIIKPTSKKKYFLTILKNFICFFLGSKMCFVSVLFLTCYKHGEILSTCFYKITRFAI